MTWPCRLLRSLGGVCDPVVTPTGFAATSNGITLDLRRCANLLVVKDRLVLHIAAACCWATGLPSRRGLRGRWSTPPRRGYGCLRHRSITTLFPWRIFSASRHLVHSLQSPRPCATKTTTDARDHRSAKRGVEMPEPRRRSGRNHDETDSE